jgi:glycosyltransferase involved in cell wall biosynthesis
VFWDSKFLITPRWRRFGRLSVITDVAMTREYFDNPPMPANMAQQFSRDWDVLFESCDHVLTLSEWAADENRRLHPREAHKVTKIGWGPNTPPLPESVVFAEPRHDRVITVGHDFQRKGMDLFDRVARAARERLPGTEWLAAGEPRDFDVAGLEVARALPPQTADEVSRLMRSAKVFLLLSRFEPSAHVIVEAQSNGLPVICSTRGGSAEGIVDGVTGYAVDPYDVDAIADRVVELMSDEDRRESFARAAHRNAVERHQWSNVADAVVAATRSEP